jgi:outer membrane receptor protein involved in Fe transport
MHISPWALLASASFAAILAPGGATAQGVPASANATSAPSQAANGEIIVTAQRRNEALSKVPVSIAAFSQAKMDQQGVRSVTDIARLTPGLSFKTGGYFSGSNTFISVRGIDSRVGAQTTGIYIDDTPTQARKTGNGIANAYPQIFDLERVEVLRGPQGTLFGAGAEGGVVRFITPKPSLDTYSGYGRTELSFTEHGDPSYEGGVAVGGPIVRDTLGFRVSAWYRRDGGYVDRVNYPTQTPVDKDANWNNAQAYKAAVTWAPAPNIHITPSVYYQRTFSHDTSGFWTTLSDPGSGEFHSGNTLRQPSIDRFVLPNLAGRVDFDGVSFVTYTSYFDRKKSETRDYTNFDSEAFVGASPYVTIPGQNAPARFTDQQHDFTQEIRLESNNASSLRWTIGGFYQRSKISAFQNIVDFYQDQLIQNTYPGQTFETYYGLPVPANGVDFVVTRRTKDTQFAGFGQADYSITDKLKVTAGVRVARVKFAFNQVADGAFNGGPSLSAGRQSQTPVTPKFGINYQLTARDLLYFSAARGFRPGGAQGPASPTACRADLQNLGLSSTPATFNSDSVWSYEVGSKNSFLGGKLRVDGSAFYIKWNNVQQLVYLANCGSSFIANFGSASSKGFDLSVSAQITEELQLSVAMGYADARLDENVGGGNTGLKLLGQKGDKIGGAPFNMTVSGEYTVPLGGDRRAYGRADYTYASKSKNGLAGLNDPAVFSYDAGSPPDPATNMVNLRAGVRFTGYDISIFANNLLDSEPALSRYHLLATSPLFTEVSFRPRTIGLTGTYRF